MDNDERRGGGCIRIKICGITTVEDARMAEKEGAHAVGVVVCSQSPRSVPLSRASEIFSSVGPFTTTVAVTHTRSFDEFSAVLACQPAAIQISHPFNIPKWYGGRVIRMVGRDDLLRGDCNAYAFDESWGKGRLYDPAAARRMVVHSPLPVILCGGLTPENVRTAIHDVHPYAVDVCTGVERAPGMKDPDRVRDFIAAVRMADEMDG